MSENISEKKGKTFSTCPCGNEDLRNRMLRTASDFCSRVSVAVWEKWVKWSLSRPYPKRNPGESIGAFGERLAALFLERQGYFILERSYRQKSGEIDVIAVWQKRVVVFVEVKTWATIRENSGGPSDAVDLVKQEKISKTALIYMKRHRLLDSSGRADVIEIVLGSVPHRPFFRHYENAFDAIGQYQMFS